jgi:hypothetical protein
LFETGYESVLVAEPYALKKQLWSTRFAPLLTALFKFYDASAEGYIAFILKC